MHEQILFAGATHTRCTTDPTPSNDDPICKKFFNSMTSLGIVLPGRKDAYSILYWNDKKVVRNTRFCIKHNNDTTTKQTQIFKRNFILI